MWIKSALTTIALALGIIPNPLGLEAKPYTVVICPYDDNQDIFVDHVLAVSPQAATQQAEEARWGEYPPPLQSLVFEGHVTCVYGP